LPWRPHFPAAFALVRAGAKRGKQKGAESIDPHHSAIARRWWRRQYTRHKAQPIKGLQETGIVSDHVDGHGALLHE
jgi:hypothetical protein